MGTPAPEGLLRLVDRFDSGRKVFQSPDYKEEQLRAEFLNPFFTALGWDMDNKQGLSETFKQVIHEESIKVAGASKAPDYTFRIGGRRTFFVEAKKPAVNVALDAAPAFQLRRYAWTARLPVSILSDFEEFAVYDCRLRPFKTDKPATARTMLLGYQDYATRWDELSGLFSPDAIQRGALERYVESTKTKKGTTAVDDAFLEEISRWRDLLAKNIALRNPRLSTRELNFAVQRTIDRLIFLRICEDRGIESYAYLQSLLNGERVYARLLKHFRDADDKYNSGLFCFSERRAARDMTETRDITQFRRGIGIVSQVPPTDRVPSRAGDCPEFSEGPDLLSLELNIDDKPLKDIIGNLYYPDSPYEFSVMPADVLGQVYEQFLGKVIRLTAGHQAKVEEKPEVRKAGGVYYTPTYIVDYIVKNTVGKLLEGGSGPNPKPLTPAQASDLRILDPACGSGSFLLGAYQYLLDWHLDYYQSHKPQASSSKPTAESVTLSEAKPSRTGLSAGRAASPLYQDPTGTWKLTTSERKRILLNNIYGVDIDSQAVEVTKLSLLLKVLEGENQETLGSQLKLYHERALPDLGSNIKCGNSLIGPDFNQGEQQALFADEEERLRVNTFDWKLGFPDIMKRGGFDAVIGNPPYIRVQAMNEWTPESLPYFAQHYVAAAKGNYDIYVVFVEKGLSLLNRGGTLGFILPHKFFNSEYGAGVRGLIAKGKHLSHVVHFGDQQVFDNATTYTCLMFLSKSPAPRLRLAKVSDLDAWRLSEDAEQGFVVSKSVSASEWNFAIGDKAALLAKIGEFPSRLRDVADRIAQGIRTSDNDVYVLDSVRGGGSQKLLLAKSMSLGEEVCVEAALTMRFLQGREVKRYHLRPSGKVVLVPYEFKEGQSELVVEDELHRSYGKAHSYLLANKDRLEAREHGRMRGKGWYGYIYPKNIEVMHAPKILVPDIADGASFALDEKGTFAFTSGYGITLRADVHESPKYVLGLLNSRLLDLYLKSVSTTMRGGFFRYFTQFMEQLPIRRIDFSDKADKARHDEMVGLVETMLKLHKDLPKAKTPHEQESIHRHIAATDRQIDELVYELYGLTEEEVRIVEGG